MSLKSSVEEPWTIRRVLAWTARDFATHGLRSPRLDAELLLSHMLGIDRVRLYMDLDQPLSATERKRFRVLVSRRRKHEPVAYVVGQKEFYGRAFEVSPAVLIPRPETEILVERALDLLPREEAARALDLGTGSGNIAVTIAAERADVSVDAADISHAALALARRNAVKYLVTSRIEFLEGNLFAAISPERRYDIIVSNPPYIPAAEVEALEPDVLLHEPRLALCDEKDGLSFHRRIVARAREFLAEKGVLLLEVGAGQATSVIDFFESEAHFEAPLVHRDYAGIDRVIEAHLK